MCSIISLILFSAQTAVVQQKVEEKIVKLSCGCFQGHDLLWNLNPHVYLDTNIPLRIRIKAQTEFLKFLIRRRQSESQKEI